MTNLEYKNEEIKVENISNIVNSFDDLKQDYSEFRAEQIASELAEMYENDNINNLNDFKNKNAAVANKLDKMLEDEEFVGNIDILKKSSNLKYEKEEEETIFTKIKWLVKKVISVPIVAYFFKAFSYVLSKVHFIIKGLISFLKYSVSNPAIFLKYVGIAVVSWYLFKLMKKPMLYIFDKIRTERQLTKEQVYEAFSSDNLKLFIREEEYRVKEKTSKKIKEIKENISILKDMLTQLNVLRLASMLTLFSFLFGLYKMLTWMIIGSSMYVCIGIIQDYYEYTKNQRSLGTANESYY